MKLSSMRSKITFASIAAIIAFMTITYLPASLQPTGQSSLDIQLSRPPFLYAAEASAPDGFFDIGSKLDAEAGFSAYFKAPGPIDLSLARSALLTVEIETSQYIIGSVDVPDYPEAFDAHVYVHVDGWMLAYNMRADPPSKVIDTRARSIDSTILEKALAVVAGATGAPFSSASLYDFRYPNATHILLVVENYSDGNCFNITLPSAYGYFDRGWAVIDGYPDHLFTINGTQATGTYSNNSYYIHYGTVAASQLLPDTSYEVCVDSDDSAWGVLMILYKEQ